ncbi:helix-turn-helix domain-containing protein [Actinoallomurus purpureus]|uniref:PucR family transcriptional regulator n=1 Tax=Actinoallomurus purpureus TaxID=478114 RepID=UPI0020921140|nr:helix-turn-helix domain-containing protein [Actinoallomurus purpureus]MCO6010774.1 helix-turn-helix domain-containing protein [Actinoallomurus purpureus]
MRSLLALSMVMAECDDPDRIVHLAVTSIPSLGRSRFHGAYLNGTGWQQVRGAADEADAHDDLETQFAVLSVAGGAVAVLGEAWAWAYPLRSLGDHLGYLVVGAAAEPSSGEQFLLRVLAQQTGIAITNARRRTRQRATADQLRVANTALAQTVATLRYSTNIHERLAAVAAAGEGPEGIAEALHELTGYPIVVEDRHGNLRAWAGSGRPGPCPRQEHADREEMLRESARTARPVRHHDRVVMPAGPPGEVLGVLALVDPDGAAGPQEFTALEHAATVLALRLARLNGLAEDRLGRDLADALLAGADEETALTRAETLGYDLRRAHRAVVVAEVSPGADVEELLDAVRDAAHDVGVGSLLAVRDGEVVVLTNADRPWPHLQAAIRRRFGGGPCRLGVGGKYDRPADFSRSYHEARLALRLQARYEGEGKIIEFDRLGVYRLLAEIEDQDGVERFVHEWLGALLDYDEHRRSDLVMTLSRYLECGRGYQATTAALAIHRSTLKYRIQRIREISGHDLNDPDVCFNLQLATRALRTLRAVRAARG